MKITAATMTAVKNQFRVSGERFLNIENAAPGLRTKCHCRKSPSTGTVRPSGRLATTQFLLSWSAA